MASNYKLNLQCVLDTTQVKQELQKLRQMQNQILGSNQGNSVNGVSGRNNGGLGNIAGLNSTLSRLTNSINQLNATINKLNAFNYRQVNTAQPVYAASNKNNTNIPIVGGSGMSKSQLLTLDKEQELYRNTLARKNATDTINRIRTRLNSQGLTTSQRSSYEISLNNQEARLAQLNQNQTLINQHYGTAINNAKRIDKVGSGFSPEHKRMLGGLAFGAGLNAISTGLEATGNQTAANIFSNVGTIGGYAIMGSAAGPIGAGIGAAVGLIQVGAEQMVAAFKEASDAAANMAKRIEQARTFDQTKTDIDIASADARAFRDNDIDYFVEQRRKYNSKIRADQRYQDWFISEFGSLEQFEKDTDRIEQEAYIGINDKDLLEQASLRKKIADTYKESVANLSKNQNRVESYTSTIESLTNRKDSISDSFKRFYYDKQFNNLLNIGDRETIQYYKNQLEDYLARQKEIFEGYRKDGFKSKNSEKVLEKIQLTEGRLDKLNSWLDNDNQRVDRFNKIIEKEELGINQYAEGKYLNRLVKKEDVNGVRMAALSHKQSRDTAFDLYKSTLNEASLATDSKTKEQLLERANSYKSSWQYSSNLFDSLNQSLGQLLVAPLQDALSKLRAPDMQNVNSLASQGVMINRADDASRTESLLDYQREQTNLQRQIKDLLEVEDYTEAPVIQ